MNACASCRRGKRKCSKERPSCSNCLRLRRDCVYTEDGDQPQLVNNERVSALRVSSPPVPAISDALRSQDLANHDSIHRSSTDLAIRTFGSLEIIDAVSRDFFTGTHQRLSTISRLHFDKKLYSLRTTPRADFAALCLSILLIEQRPQGRESDMQSPLYYEVKNLMNLLETRENLSLDLVQCRVLVTFYEMGHGLHRAAYISLAGAARAARILGLHRKPWQNPGLVPDWLKLEEAKRTYSAIILMDRFINLCNGDALFMTDDPVTTDALPVDDLIWSEGSVQEDLEDLIVNAPLLNTPFDKEVGQLAREVQISHLVGRVVRHVFDPIADPQFNIEAAAQLERTLKAYQPLLSEEELRIGKYCGAFGMCNSSLYVLYEWMLNQHGEYVSDRHRILRAIEETALGALTFAAAAYGDTEGNYPPEIFSPYLPYSLCQAAVVCHRLWTQTGHLIYQERLELLKSIIRNFTNRWMVAWKYLDIIERLDDNWPPIGIPAQGGYIGAGTTGHWAR